VRPERGEANFNETFDRLGDGEYGEWRASECGARFPTTSVYELVRWPRSWVLAEDRREDPHATGAATGALARRGKELGPLFAPEFMLDWVAAYLVMDELDKHGFSIPLHDAHPMEVDAQVRAGLPPAPNLRGK
jgi:hypothetical protein